MTEPLYDVLAIGFGPANIALAIAFEEREMTDNVLFLEQMAQPGWQVAMLLDGADIQNNALRDLVTPRNPRSRYTFINFLHEQGRLFEHLNLGLTYPLRKEYADYITWVARHFDRWVSYGQQVCVIDIVHVATGEPVWRVRTAGGRDFRGRTLVVAPGRSPFIPEPFHARLGARVFHLTRYLTNLAALTEALGAPPQRIGVIGGSQSAVEIVLDLAGRLPNAQIVNIMRGYGYALKDTSPFSDEVYFPSYVDYYFNASQESKRILDAQLRRTNYSSADRDVIDRLYLMMYEQKLDRRERIEMMTNCAVRSVETNNTGVWLEVEEIHRHHRRRVQLDCAVLATGFRDLGSRPEQEKIPPLLVPIQRHLKTDGLGVVEVARDYRLNSVTPNLPLPPIFLNGLCEASHGMGDAGSFSLLSLRADLIAGSLGKCLEAGAPRELMLAEAG